MDLRQIKPIHGWRAFAGEVGVVVLGVLLALGAQQAVESWQVRQDIAAFRETIDREIAYNLYVLDVRARQIGCDARRTAVIQQWLDTEADTALPPRIYPVPAETITQYRSAWESRDADTYRKLPSDVRQKYAMFYDGLQNLRATIQEQRLLWKDLTRFSVAGPLSLEERRETQVNLTRLRDSIESDFYNTGFERQLAKDLGLRPAIPQDIDLDLIRRRSVCTSILKPRRD